MSPAAAQAGQSVTLTFTVRDGAGLTVSELPLAHQQPMHSIIISKDLRRFAHLHPSFNGSSLRLEHTFADAGEYLVILDYQEPGRGQVVDTHRVHIAGPAPSAASVLTESDGTERAEGLEMTLRTDAEVRAGQAVMLHFDVKDVATGKPVLDLEPYLGSTAHFMILSADAEDFVHAHAVDRQHASTVSAHAAFPRSGLYKLWVQVQRRGAVVTIPFVLRVGVADIARDTSSAGSEHAPGGHLTHAH
jgi:hypothetical protein